MFDILFRGKNNKETSIMDILSIDITKLGLHKLAIEKAIGMVAKAIAKSEFVVCEEKARIKNHIYWMLNVRPNPNETATDFWMEVIRRIFIDTECLICCIGKEEKKLYIIDGYTTDNNVMFPQVYSNVTISSNGKTLKLDRNFNADEIIHLRCKNKKIKSYMEKVLKMHDDVVSSLEAAEKIGNTPKFTLNMNGPQQVMREKKADGTEKVLTIDEYKEKIKKTLSSEEIEVLVNSAGLEVKMMEIKKSTTSEDVVKIAKEIFVECALAFDIPKAVFLGEITEKADSTNEFITYAVGWVVEMLNDSLNAKIVGEKDYIKGEKIWIDMSKYKHVDIIESAANLSQLRSIGFNFDEIRELVGWEALETEFSKERVITKNYTDNLGGEKK